MDKESIRVILWLLRLIEELLKSKSAVIMSFSKITESQLLRIMVSVSFGTDLSDQFKESFQFKELVPSHKLDWALAFLNSNSINSLNKVFIHK